MFLPPLGHLCGFQVLLPVNSTTMVMGAQMIPWHSGFNSFGYILKTGLLDHMIVLDSVFLEEYLYYFPKWLY